MTITALDERFFRHESGKLVATLVRRFGVRRLSHAEDAVQVALLAALENWPSEGVPDNPQGWLFRVARNELLSELRQSVRRHRLLERILLSDTPSLGDAHDPGAVEEMHGDLLRMLFACCDPSIVPESSLVFSLKTLCGFSIPEVAARLFITEANVYKRFTRARNAMQAIGRSVDNAQLDDSRLPAVHRILYAMFSEGHLSAHAEMPLRKDLCEEAIRLTTLLADSPLVAHPETHALLALMHLHASRMTAREDMAGGLVLLEDQDRTLWDTGHIGLGMEQLAQSASGNHFSRYHAEAAIAAEHCRAPCFSEYSLEPDRRVLRPTRACGTTLSAP